MRRAMSAINYRDCREAAFEGANDVPISSIVRRVEIELRTMLGEEHGLDPIGAKDNIPFWTRATTRAAAGAPRGGRGSADRVARG